LNLSLSMDKLPCFHPKPSHTNQRIRKMH
jgi:hypothetical protein